MAILAVLNSVSFWLRFTEHGRMARVSINHFGLVGKHKYVSMYVVSFSRIEFDMYI